MKLKSLKKMRTKTVRNMAKTESGALEFMAFCVEQLEDLDNEMLVIRRCDDEDDEIEVCGVMYES